MNPSLAVYQGMKRADINFVTSVPCVNLQELLVLVSGDPEIIHVPATREEEGVGICAGAWMGGRRPALLMQNSGLGNSINALASLDMLYGIPLLMIISHRGGQGRAGYWSGAHGPANGSLARRHGHPSFLAPARRGGGDGGRGLELRLRGLPSRGCAPGFGVLEGIMLRIEAIFLAAKAAAAQDALLVCNIGYPSRELFSVKDRPENFYMLGSMGLASSIGLGLALARPERKVMVLDGDGSVLMNLGTLATIANYAPENYLLVILDNCCYGSTGSQPTCTHLGTDLFALAKAAGVKDVKKVDKDEDLLGALLGRGVVIAKVDAGNANVPIIGLSPQQIIERFSRCARPAPSS
jgi:sulfopyruvate decarboxylase subunit beta